MEIGEKLREQLPRLELDSDYDSRYRKNQHATHYADNNRALLDRLMKIELNNFSQIDFIPRRCC